MIAGSTTFKNRTIDSSTGCICPAATYMDVGRGNICYGVPLGVDLTTMGMTIENLKLDPGYWRIAQTGDVRKCLVEGACMGGSNMSEYCRDGHDGPYCNICKNGFRKDVTGLCDACSTTIKNILATVLVFVASIVGAFVCYFAWNRWMANSGKAAKSVASAAKIIFVR